MGIFDFLSREQGQQRRQALEGLLAQFIPPEVRPQLGLLSELNPVTSMERASQDAQRIVAPSVPAWARVGAVGDMLSNVGGVVAPAMIANRAGMPVANALTESLAGFGGQADDVARYFAADESGALKLYRGTNDSGEKITGGIGEGLLFGSLDENVARLYGDKISAFELPDTAKVLIEGTAEFSKIAGRKRGNLLRTMKAGENIVSAANDVIEKAKAAGYDAVSFNSMPDMGVAVINRSIVRSVPK